MRKEIHEQPAAVADTLRGRIDEFGQIVLDEVRMSDQDFRDIDKVFIIACGTSYHAGLVTKYAIEHWTRIPCEVELASEFRYRDPVLDRSTLVVAISQSGETMDTLMAVRHAKDQKARVLSISNTVGSTIRASPTRCCTRGPASRSPSPPLRRSSPSSPPATSWACTSRRCAASSTPTRWGPCSRSSWPRPEDRQGHREP